MKKLLCLILSVLLLASLCACKDGSDPTTGTTGPTRPTGPLYDRSSYTATDEDAIAAHDRIVMKVGDATISNGLFQFAYWLEYFSFMNTYGSYAITLGFDYTLPLDQQTYNNAGYTWQQHFIGDTVNNLRESLALYLAWQETDLEVPEELAAELAQLEKDLEETAKENGYETAEEYLLAFYGPGVTRADFCEYMRMSYLSDLYYNYSISRIEVTDQQISDYFDRYESDLAQSSIVKDGTSVYHIRHILLPVAADAGEDEWEKTHQQAQDLLDEWLAGEATQSTFVEMVQKYSKDDETLAYGGLYEGCTEGSSFVQEFKDWYLAEGRKAGDYGIIKTASGYHIMYHVGTEETWHYMCGRAVFNLAVEQFSVDITNKYALEVDYPSIMLGLAPASVLD